MTSTDTTDKPFKIDKRRVYEAYKAVRSSKGGAGVDGQTIEAFEAAKKAGKCRFIGYTNCKDPQVHVEMLRHAEL